MGTVSDNVLRWLYDSLKAEYYDVERTYSDAAQVLSKYSTFAPRTEVYTFENGAHALLLLLQGTLPVLFRGTTYRFPISVWLPHDYPNNPPMVFVTPTRDMNIRPGQHVSIEGKVYHPYLSHWSKSDLNTFLAILSDIFSREPPVIARQNQPPGPPQGLRHKQTQDTPPIPARPISIHQTAYLSQSESSQHPRTPNIPSKSSATIQRESLPVRQDSLRSSSGAPPIPPKPGQSHAPEVSNPETNGNRSLAPYDRNSWNGPPLPLLPHQIRRPEREDSQPPRPSSVAHSPAYHNHPQDQRPTPFAIPTQALTYPHHARQPPPPQGLYQQQIRSQQHQQHYQPQIHSYSPSQSIIHQQQQQPKPNPPLSDLLSSPLDNPTSTLEPFPSTNHPAPPIPLNPEKDHLLSLISTALQPLLTKTTSQNACAIPALLAQQSALQSFHHALNSELASLQSLDATLSGNEQTLHAALRDAEAIERGLSRRELPGVDDVLVAPTVVGEQLYGLVAEERGIADALFALTRALDGGRVSGEVFVKLTRGLAREMFLKRALARKIAKGMGLSGEEGW